MTCPRSDPAVAKECRFTGTLLVLCCPLLGVAPAQGITLEGRAYIAAQTSGYASDGAFVDIDADGRRDTLR